MGKMADYRDESTTLYRSRNLIYHTPTSTGWEKSGMVGTHFGYVRVICATGQNRNGEWWSVTEMSFIADGTEFTRGWYSAFSERTLVRLANEFAMDCYRKVKRAASDAK